MNPASTTMNPLRCLVSFLRAIPSRWVARFLYDPSRRSLLIGASLGFALSGWIPAASALTIQATPQPSGGLLITVDPQGQPVYGLAVFGADWSTSWAVANGGTTTSVVNSSWSYPFGPEPVTIKAVGPAPSYAYLAELQFTPAGWSGTSGPIAPRLALQYWQANDWPGRPTGNGHYETQQVWVDGYWEPDGYWEQDGNGDWYFVQTGEHWVPDGHYETQEVWVEDIAWDGLYGSSWTTTAGMYHQYGASSGYAAATVNRGYLTNLFNMGDALSFRAWGRAPTGNCNNFEASVYAPSGSLVQSALFGNNSYWQPSITFNANGVWRIDIKYTGATNFTPSAGTVSYYVGVGMAAQSITFPEVPNHVYGDPPFALGGTANSGLPVSYAVVAGLASVSGNTVTLTGGSTVTIRASQTGGGRTTASPIGPLPTSYGPLR